MAYPAHSLHRLEARILVVDDSASIRSTILNLLKTCADESQLSFAVDGRHALQQASRAALIGKPYDVILLDIEMPLMDGLQALDELIKLKPAPKVIMSSALTRRGASASMQALGRGAADYVCKPSSNDNNQLEEFRRELLEKVVFWSKRPTDSRAPQRQVTLGSREPTTPSTKEVRRQPLPKAPAPLMATKAVTKELPTTGPSQPVGKTHTKPHRAHSLKEGPSSNTRALRQSSHEPRSRTTALAIGSSTGGPQALLRILSDCRADLPFPIFITQHMPATFTTILAEQIDKCCSLKCYEGADGQIVRPGEIYLAPGSHHLTVTGKAGNTKLSLSSAAPVNFCKPAVDPMLQSLLRLYGSGLSIIILTGMGQDGLVGCREASERHARIIAQDEETSIVWGMPGAIARAGIANQIAPLDNISSLINGLA